MSGWAWVGILLVQGQLGSGLDLETVRLGALGEDGRRDELGRVVRGLGGQVLAVRELPEVVGAAGGHRPAHPAGSGVVGGPGQQPVALEHLVQVGEVGHGGVGGLDRVTAIVDPPVDAQDRTCAGAGHELPQARGARTGVGVGVEARLDHGQVDEVLGQPRGGQAGLDEGSIGRAASQIPLEVGPARPEEVPHPTLHIAVGADRDVEVAGIRLTSEAERVVGTHAERVVWVGHIAVDVDREVFGRLVVELALGLAVAALS